MTVAYLMSHMQLSMNDAFSLVRARRANVGPNFHFMEQLHAFERELTTMMTTTTTTNTTTTTTNTAMQRRSGQSSTDSADGTSDESCISSASSSGDQRCDHCGTPLTSANRCSQCNVRAAPHSFNPSIVFGQSPDSGIEFDRWTPGAGE